MASRRPKNALIIGGGVIGLAIARELCRGRIGRVTVVDRGRVGGEASWAAAGMLAPNAECDAADDFHRLCTDSLRLYPDFAAHLLEESGIDIELDRAGTLYAAFTDADAAEIRERFNWQSAAGMNVEHLTATETVEVEPSISGDVRESLFFPEDWQVENRKLVQALRESCVRCGVEIFENTEVLGLTAENGRATGAATTKGTISAGHTIIAAGAWTSFLKTPDGSPATPVKPIRGQILCYRPAERLLRHVVYCPRGYLVPRCDGRVLAGSTAEDVGFDKRVTDDGVSKIWAVATELAPSIAAIGHTDSWTGFRPFAPPRGMPVIGPHPEIDSLFIATGHYRNGILLTPLTAKIVTEAILGTNSSAYLDLYGPACHINSSA